MARPGRDDKRSEPNLRATPTDVTATAPGPDGSDDLKRELENEHRKSRLLATFFDDAARVAADDRSVWQILAQRATEAVGDSGVVSLVSEDGHWLEAVGVYHPDPDRAQQIWQAVARRPIDGSIYGDVIRQGSVVFIPSFRPEDTEANLRRMSAQQLELASRSGVRSIIALPLLLRGRVAGVIATSRIVTPEPYTEADVEVLQALAARASVVLDNARVHRDLRATTDRLATMIDESPIATIVLDTEGTVLVWNRAAEELLGWTAAEVTGQHLPAAAVDGGGELGFGLIAADETIGGREIQLRHKAGAVVTVALYAAPLHEAGAIAGSVLRLVDLSDRKRLQAQLLQAQRLESVGRLAGGVAHDFNNVLTAILGFARLIGEEVEQPGVREHARSIESAAGRASELVRQLLAFARQQVLEPRVLQVDAVIGEVQPLIERLIGEDVIVDARVQPGLWSIEADPAQIEQVIVNLAVNARDAMQSGGRLTIEARNVDLDETYATSHPEVTPGPHVMLAVSDTGAGMDAETVGHIFEPFFTTKETGRGTGLGLATVYGVVKQSGGHIWVYSEPGRGTTFRLYFPRSDRPVDAAAGPDAAAVAGGSETILVAEDELILRELIDVVLGRLGYRVLMAPQPAAAIELAARERVDLLLTDVVMPGMSGMEVAERIRERSPGLRVVFMSGYTEAALEHHGEVGERDAFLQKPFTPDTLTQAVRRALD